MPLDLDLKIYRINYKSSDSDQPEVVVDRARSCLGECK